MYGSASVPFPPLTKAVEFKETTERAPLLLFKLDELDNPPEKIRNFTSNYALNISLQYITLLFKSYSFLYIIYLGVKKSFDT